MKINLELLERFHEKWVLNPETGCWEWTASTAGRGYGQFRIPGTRKNIYAHRLSYILFFGEIPDDSLVCHQCDNPKCVRPSHLFVGTSAGNLQDMKTKGRHLFGGRNLRSKLDDGKVRRIHTLSESGFSQAKIAKTCGVAQSTVWKILKGMRWEHIYREVKQGR